MLVKFGLKIPNRLGKNVRKSQGDGIFFDSHCTVGIGYPQSLSMLFLRCNKLMFLTLLLVRVRLVNQQRVTILVAASARNKQ